MLNVPLPTVRWPTVASVMNNIILINDAICWVNRRWLARRSQYGEGGMPVAERRSEHLIIGEWYTQSPRD